MAHWSFDEESGTTAVDSSANGFNLTLNANAGWTGESMVGAGALDASDSSAEATRSHEAEMAFTESESFSLATWVHVPSLPGSWVTVMAKSRETRPWYGIWISSANKWVFGGNISGQGSAYNLTGSSVTTGWHHLVILQDGAAGTRKLYLDGSLDASGNAQDADGNGIFRIAKYSSEAFNGILDETRLYDRALNGTEISNLAGTGSGVFIDKLSGNDGYRLEVLSGGKVRLTLGDGTSTYTITSAKIIPSGDWTKVTAKREGDTIKLYLNDTVEASTLDFTGKSVGANSVDLEIGSSFKGDMDQTRIVKGTAAVATYTVATIDYTYNNANQLTREQIIGGNYKDYTYDNNGSNTRIVEKDSQDQTVKTITMAYDTLNRLTSWSDGTNTETSTYRGAEWHRHSQTASGTTKKFLYDGDNVTADVVSGSVDTYYVTPFLDQNLSMTRSSADYYYSQDGLGSVRTLTDSSEVVKNTYDYTAFGETYAPGRTVTISQRYTFTGRELNPTSGSMYYRYRTYSPVTGRFLHRDPAGYPNNLQGNLYDYVYSDPENWIDPYGLGQIHFGGSVSGGLFLPPLMLQGVLAGVGFEVSAASYVSLEWSPYACKVCASFTFTALLGGGTVTGTGGGNIIVGGGPGKQTSGGSVGGGLGGAGGWGAGIAGSLDYDPSSKSVTATIGRLGPTFGVYGAIRINFTCTACVNCCPLSTLGTRLAKEIVRVVPLCFLNANAAIDQWFQDNLGIGAGEYDKEANQQGSKPPPPKKGETGPRSPSRGPVGDFSTPPTPSLA